jgi:hypothetical protein
MGWISSTLRNSIYGMLGHGQPTDSMLVSRMEDIRELMLELLGDAAPEHPGVTRRIRYATDVNALWYLRGDLMAVLASSHGERQARRAVRNVTDMFRGVVPGSLTSRPSPLR